MTDRQRVHKLRTDHFHWREINDEIIALDPTTSTYMSVSGSGRLLWQQLLEGATEEALASRLVANYGIEEERARHDVDVFVEELASSGWLEP